MRWIRTIGVATIYYERNRLLVNKVVGVNYLIDSIATKC